MLTFLTGYKTHIVAGLAALGAFFKAMGWLTEEQWATLLGILGPLALITLRIGMAKVEAQVAHVETAVVVQSATVQQVDATLARVEHKVAQTPSQA